MKMNFYTNCGDEYGIEREECPAAIIEENGDTAVVVGTDWHGDAFHIHPVTRHVAEDGTIGWLADYMGDDALYDPLEADHRRLVELAKTAGPEGDEVRRALLTLVKACAKPRPVPANFEWISA
jgi:hypothetical protein